MTPSATPLGQYFVQRLGQALKVPVGAPKPSGLHQ